METQIDAPCFRPQRHRLDEQPKIIFTYIRAAVAVTDALSAIQKGEAPSNGNSPVEEIRKEPRAA